MVLFVAYAHSERRRLMMIQSGLESSPVSTTKTCLIETYHCMALKLAENSFKEIDFKTQFTMNIRLNELCCYIFLFILFCKST